MELIQTMEKLNFMRKSQKIYNELIKNESTMQQIK